MLQLIPALLLTLGSTAPPAQQAEFDLERTEAVLTRLIEESLEEKGVASLSIALVRGEEIVWTAAFGYSNVFTRTPATPETIYCTGSTFKAVTATALMQLQEEGKLALDDPVNLYLGDSPIEDQSDQGRPVTFRHILSHWSGLTPGASTVPLWSRLAPQTLEELAAGLSPVRAPGEKWEYNNFAYGLAGLLVERIAERDYERYIVKEILRPLGVKTAHPTKPSARMVERMALPYIPARGEPVATLQVRYDVFPAGDIYLTAEDMARFLGAHLNGGVFNGKRILSEDSVKEMHTPPFSGTYALGFGVHVDARGHTIIQHAGGTPGYSSQMIGDVDAKVGVYFMSTSQAPASISDAALKLLRGEEFVAPWEREIVEVPLAVLEEYVGEYDGDDGNLIHITLDDGVLHAQSRGPSPAPLLPLSPTEFLIEPVDARVVFERDDEGAVSGLVLSRDPTVIRGKRRR